MSAPADAPAPPDLAAAWRARFGFDFPGDDPAAGLDPAAVATLAGILGRCSYRRFDGRDVPDDLRTTLLACAQSAPAKSDLQQYAIVDIRDAARKAALAGLCDTPLMADAPVLLVFCGDLRRARRLAESRGYTYAQNTADSFMNAAVDAALAMQAFVLAAEAAGLGTCCVSQVRKRPDEVADLLALPESVFPVAGLGAGYPGEAREPVLRLPPAVVVHRDAYDDGDLVEEVDAYDRRRHAVRPLAAKPYKPETFGEVELYGWSENATRRLTERSDLSEFGAWVRARDIALD